MAKRPQSARPVAPQNNIVEKLERICGAPALIPREDRDAYDELRLMLVEAEQPADVIGMMHVQQLTDLYWDEWRRRGCATSLVKAAMSSALSQLLRDSIGVHRAEALAQQYASGDATSRREIEDDLAQVGHTMADVRHIAFSRQLDSIELLERLGLTGDRRREACMQALEHRREVLARRRAEATKASVRTPLRDEGDGVERIGVRPPPWQRDA